VAEPADATPLALNSLFSFICCPNINHSLTPRPSAWWRQQVGLRITGYNKPKEALKKNHFYREHYLARLKMCSWKLCFRLTAFVRSYGGWGNGALFNNEQLLRSSTAPKTKHYVPYNKVSINKQKCLSAWKYCHLQSPAAPYSFLSTHCPAVCSLLLTVICTPSCRISLQVPVLFFLQGIAAAFIFGRPSSVIRCACP